MTTAIRQAEEGPEFEKHGGAPRPFAADYSPADEALVPQLLAETAADAATEARIGDRARRYVTAIRHARGGIGGLEDFMHEYSLSTPEGLALMSLAEALLRVPDAATQDRLIEDKLGRADWEHAAARESESFLVSATTWALGLTARIVHPPETPEGIIRRLAQRLGQPTVRTAARQAMRLLGHQFVLGETIEDALSRGREARRQGYRYSFDMLGEGARTARDAERYFSPTPMRSTLSGGAPTVRCPVARGFRSSSRRSIRAMSRASVSACLRS